MSQTAHARPAPRRYAAAPAEASAAAGGGLAEQEILTLRAQLVH